jgi:serine/threonine protein kinase
MNSTPDSNGPPDSDGLYGNSLSDLFLCALDGTGPTPQAQPWQPPTAEHLAELLPQYQIEKLIGRGGMGAVYRGVQLSLKRPVAIKLLPAELAANADFVSRFQREAQTLARLQHPGIVAVHDFGRTAEGHLYFIMEFVDGTDLQNIIHNPGLQPTQALELTLQICEALQYAHSQGVIHRDIKPANVLLTQDGRAKLGDFGLARPLTTTPGMTAASLVMGTPEYMAPEQWAGKVDHRADIYALGVMLYEMLTGTRPHGAFDLPSIKAHVDARLDEVVVKAMRQAPEQRYQNVSELRDEVQRIRTTRPPQAVPIMPPQPKAASAPKPRQRRRSALDTFGWAAAIALILLFAAALFWVMQQEQKNKAATITQEEAAPPTVPTEPKIEAPAPKPAPIVHAPPTIKTVTEDKPKAVVSMPPPSLVPTPPPSVPLVPATVPASPAPSVIEVFSRESQNLMAWVLSPLEEAVPPDIRQKLTYVREDLIDEGKTKPTSSLDAYRAAYYLCEVLLTALNERDQTRVAAGFRAAQSAAAQPIGSQAFDARRNYLMSWPQFDREQSQRTALSQQNQARTAVSGEAQKVAWANKVERLRVSLDARYRSFRDAMRK